MGALKNDIIRSRYIGISSLLTFLFQAPSCLAAANATIIPVPSLSTPGVRSWKNELESSCKERKRPTVRQIVVWTFFFKGGRGGVGLTKRPTQGSHWSNLFHLQMKTTRKRLGDVLFFFLSFFFCVKFWTGPLDLLGLVLAHMTLRI